MLECHEYRIEREKMMLELSDLCGVGNSIREKAEGSDEKMMDMLIGRGMGDDYEKGMSIVQSYVRKSMRRRKSVIG